MNTNQTITTDQGKVYRLEEAWVTNNRYVINAAYGVKEAAPNAPLKKVMVLVPEEE